MQFTDATGTVYSVKDGKLIVDNGDGKVSIDEKDFSDIENRVYGFLSREIERSLYGKKRYSVVHTQEILVDFPGYIYADSEEEAIEKLKEKDIEFTGKFSLTDTHYIGDYERLYIHNEDGDIIYDTDS